MDAATIQKIVDLAPINYHTIHSLAYADRKLELVVPPKAEKIVSHTLDGFVNLLEAGIDNFDVEKSFIHVTSAKSVFLMNRHATAYGVRQVHVVAEILEGLTDFPYFNLWGPQEEFVIGLQSHFQPNDSLAYLLKLASHIDAKESVKTTDSGVSQELVVRSSVAFAETVETKSRITLKPYRTFRELDQPASDFIFRVKEQAKFALFEADGGAWKIEAINAIASWLSNRIKTSEVTALASLPIIS